MSGIRLILLAIAVFGLALFLGYSKDSEAPIPESQSVVDSGETESRSGAEFVMSTFVPLETIHSIMEIVVPCFIVTDSPENLNRVKFPSEFVSTIFPASCE